MHAWQSCHRLFGGHAVTCNAFHRLQGNVSPICICIVTKALYMIVITCVSVWQLVNGQRQQCCCVTQCLQHVVCHHDQTFSKVIHVTSCCHVCNADRHSQPFQHFAQELLGTVVDLAGNVDTGSLTLQAACHLPANTPLTSSLTALGADPEHLIMTHGLASLACAQQARRGQGPALLPWQSPDTTSFQLCVEPPDEDELRDSKLEVLLASALGTTHVLTLSSSQVVLEDITLAVLQLASTQ